MCASYQAKVSNDDLLRKYNADLVYDRLPEKIRFFPNYLAPIVYEPERRVVALMEWGLLPATAKDKSLKKKYATFNARAEGLQTSRLFAPAFNQNQRCVLPATSFYEYADRVGRKQLVEIGNGGEILSIAGLWQTSTLSSGEVLYTFTMITTTPSPQIEAIHSRMPVILEDSRIEEWLDPKRPSEKLTKLLLPTSLVLEIQERSK